MVLVSNVPVEIILLCSMEYCKPELHDSSGSALVCLRLVITNWVSGALRHVQSIWQLLCVKRRDYGNVSLVRGSYFFDFDVRQLFVRWFL